MDKQIEAEALRKKTYHPVVDGELREWIAAFCHDNDFTCGLAEAPYVAESWDLAPESVKETYCKDAALILSHITPIIKAQVARGIFGDIKSLPNPYSEKMFPRGCEWAGKIEREKGLTDDEITGISGALGRLGFEVLMYMIEELEENYLPEEAKE